MLNASWLILMVKSVSFTHLSRFKNSPCCCFLKPVLIYQWPTWRCVSCTWFCGRHCENPECQERLTLPEANKQSIDENRRKAGAFSKSTRVCGKYFVSQYWSFAKMTQWNWPAFRMREVKICIVDAISCFLKYIIFEFQILILHLIEISDIAQAIEWSPEPIKALLEY